MNREIVFSKLQDVFRDVFADDALVIHDQMSALDIAAWDSIKHITLMEAVQDEFDILFEFDEIFEMKDVDDIVTAVCRKL